MTVQDGIDGVFKLEFFSIVHQVYSTKVTEHTNSATSLEEPEFNNYQLQIYLQFFRNKPLSDSLCTFDLSFSADILQEIWIE